MNQCNLFSQVGDSERTLGKHVLLNKILGREVGVMSKFKNSFGENEYTILDLCAGDGEKSYYSNTSSPELIEKHARFLRRNSKTKVNIFFFEKDKNTCDILKSHCWNRDCNNLNSLEIKEMPGKPSKDSRCFIHADPNMISDWPISDDLLSNSPKFTTMLITMGCNVGGLKRIKLEERAKWGQRLDAVIDNIPEWHDALLIWLKGDKAQWSYFVTGPAVWHDKGIYSKDAHKAFKYMPKGIGMARLKREPKRFYEIRDILFYTKKELEKYV